ncbi:toxin [Clostridium botulinum]|nr:toxin [Clostridium botulinum]NFL58420.1 toxin [Clostridium botulinum]NFL61382.1 toxin [Clostridium botulinum]NFO66844.1 toxin [Clostridium botulinum]
MTNLKSYIIYDWKETILKNSKDNYSINEIIPKTFSKKICGGRFLNSTLSGNWKSWTLTDEAEGPHPILKCTIDNGYLEIYSNTSSEKHSLKDIEIKICMAIKPNSDGTHSLCKNSFYIKSNSLKLSEDRLIVSHYLEKLILAWFKDNHKYIELFINRSRIQTRVEGDLSLLGWDIESSVSYKTMNEFIKKDNLYEKKFHQYMEVRRNEYTIDGEFGPWQMTTGADGQNIRFLCPIKSATYKINDDVYIAKPDNFIIIQVDLKYFDSKTTIIDPSGLNNGQQFNLKVKTDSTDEINAVILVGSRITDVNEDLYPGDDVSLEIVFKTWFNANIQKFTQIFSYILLNETSKIPEYQWLKPTQISYGSASVTMPDPSNPNKELSNLDASTFAAMAMVENHKNDRPNHAVDNRFLELSKTPAAVAISMPEFLKHFLVNGLQAMQIDNLDAFEVSSENLMITNKKKINFGKIQAQKRQVDTLIEPNNFKMAIQNNQVILEIVDATWQQVEGVTGHFGYRQAYNLILKNENNVYKPVLEESGEVTLSYFVTEEAWKTRQDAIISATVSIIVGTIIGALSSIGSDKLYKFLKSKYVVNKNKASMKLSGKDIKEISSMIDVPEAELLSIRRKNSKTSLDDISLMSSNGSTSPGDISIMQNKPRALGERLQIAGLKLLGGLITSFGYTIGFILPEVLKDVINANINNDFKVLPGIQEFSQQCIGPVQWPENGELKINFAKLQGVYLLGGNLVKTLKTN